MSEHFSITTADPRFDPNGPAVINGYLFVPAPGTRHIAGLDPRPRKTVVEVKRRKVVSHG